MLPCLATAFAPDAISIVVHGRGVLLNFLKISSLRDNSEVTFVDGLIGQISVEISESELVAREYKSVLAWFSSTPCGPLFDFTLLS